ncbi:hypothetical protein Shal_2292 [Shewanella halifaxensis HAW-EB4]|uniref:Polysaccharide pyruvyl transferase domain-containing protein n=1 Tax=Shewanella halifaxensis (strain HAW-EB4) TaxID=458817 RepID=B0TVG6_SHEHH|nr:polysaccharide pyruvyl transferase family protein [Shewanella halifaxensis]ABZ76851.1 hypothetical protein Shal_2292 [Shewanella halifaxensis HAW-EB4]
MKTILFSTSSLWNCGDDYIRDGVNELLQLKEDVRVLWWNRGFGITNSYANALKVNLPLMDYFIVAGTPKWIFNNEKIYQYCLDHSIPLSIIGVGTKDFVTSAQYELMRKIARSGLCEIVIARDKAAYQAFKELGFTNCHLMLDPCFFKPTRPGSTLPKLHIVGWREQYSLDGDPKLALKHPLLVVKRLLSGGALNFADKNKLKQTYDNLFIDYFNRLPSPKIVTVHDNREIAAAEALFGKDNVYYATDYEALFSLYSRAKSYFGSRIHGAIPAIIHGASAQLVYTTEKAEVVTQSMEIIGKSYPEISDFVSVHQFNQEFKTIPPLATSARIELETLHQAIETNRLETQKQLALLPTLRDYLNI